jgi:hypothetical protein
MRSTHLAIGSWLALAALVVLLPWPAVGQAPAEKDYYSSQTLDTGGNHSLWYNRYGRGGRDPELNKLLVAESNAEREVSGLVREYSRKEDDKERAKIKEKLSAALSKQFEAQQKRREHELAKVEAQVKKLRELMKKRGEERKTIIDRRLDQLMREAEGLGWTPPPGLRGTSSNVPLTDAQPKK